MIETACPYFTGAVSPHAGEWIEMEDRVHRLGQEHVSPHAGEWIEI